MKQFVLLLVCAWTTTCVAESPVSTTSLTFLRNGADYTIQFPTHLGAFTKETSSVAYGTVSDGQRFPVTTKFTHIVSAFTVRELGPSQWALLEHPSSLSDAATWNLKLASAAKLTPENILHFQSTDEGKKRLAQLQKFATAPINTSRTWVNLSHAIAIAPLPTEDIEPEISVNVSVSKTNKE